VLAGLGAIGRVAHALVGTGTLAELAEHALGEMRDALDLETAVLYLPATERPQLQHYVMCADGRTDTAARPEVSFDQEAWRLAVASGLPLLFHERATWLGTNPFDPPADSWFVLPLVSQGSLLGVVAASSVEPLRLGPTSATVLSLLGDLLTAGIATARLRQEVQRTELERERIRLASDMHEGLAQDLALAVRELAMLESSPGAETAAQSRARLREALTSANRIVRARLQDLSVTVPLGGVQEAVEQLCDRFAEQGTPVVLRTRGPVTDVSPEVVAVVTRVLTEALTNVDKHARARRVDVHLIVESERIVLSIHDDGTGFSIGAGGGPGDGHFGHTLMSERARSIGGEVTLTSSPGAGTKVLLHAPRAG
jgi:signal transduction histidine kinase